MNLFETMRMAGGGDAFSTLARQYGLTEDQVRLAMEAFMPAFAASLKRNASDPIGMFNLLQALAGGRHAAHYQDPGRAMSPAGIGDGNAVLGQLFGSPEVSRAVAAQVHAATGIGEAVLKQMLPVVATMIAGGLARQMQAGANPMLEALMRQMGAGPAPTPPSAPASKGPLDRWEEEQRERERARPPGMGDNPFGRMFEDMMRAAFPAAGGSFPAAPGGSPAASAWRGPDAGTGPRTPADLFGDMFEPGRRLSEAHQRNMEWLLDQFLGGRKAPE